MKEKKSNFSGSIGFVLAAAGSAVGVGNIWRFPYLCAKTGDTMHALLFSAIALVSGIVVLIIAVLAVKRRREDEKGE